MTSRGIADGTGGEGLRDITALIGDEGVVKRNNPHIKFSNQSFKGYAVLEARPDELLVEYRAPRTVKSPSSSVFTLQGFRVENGVPRVEPAGAVLERRPPRVPLLPATAARKRDCRADDAQRGRGPRFTG